MTGEQLALSIPDRKLKPSAEKVLEMLRAAGERGVETGDFIRAYVYAFSQRMTELRKAGFDVVSEPIGEGSACYVYRLNERRTEENA